MSKSIGHFHGSIIISKPFVFLTSKDYDKVTDAVIPLSSPDRDVIIWW